MNLRPLTQRAARDWIDEHHRHSGAPRGDVIRVGVEVDGQIVGVGMAGRPVARMLDDGYTLEILRVCTQGAENACSAIYGALCRAAKALGWRTVITYTLASETAASVRAAGFVRDADVRAEDSWSRPSRGRVTEKRPTCAKVRWRRDLYPQGNVTPEVDQ